jgi:heterodisulfide reductase subunit C/nitrate reductase gamma subunit
MFFTLSLYASLTIFLLALIYKVGTWFTRSVGFCSKRFTVLERLYSALKGMAGVFFSAKLGALLKTLVMDVLWQRRTLKEDFLRWLMHMLIFWGFTLLLLMHALGSILMTPVFPEYYATLNPYLFLRDLFGLMVMAGVALAVYRRVFMKVPRLRTHAMDKYAIALVGVIILSGMFLEAVKITSHSAFQAMVEEYSDSTDEEAVKPLESYWVRNFGLVSPDEKGPFDADTLAQGEDLHETSCAACHASPQWAFTGYPIARAISPIATGLDRTGAATVLWTIHLWACFLGLAYLPFSKMFHLIATPISLLANAVMDPERSNPANIQTRQVMELDACTHCNTCSLRCSAVGAFASTGNDCILPSEKMVLLKRLAFRKSLSPQDAKALMEGIYLCTSCDRCTVVCPSGINLREMWLNLRGAQLDQGYAAPLVLSPLSFVVGMDHKNLASDDYPDRSETAKKAMAKALEAMTANNKPIAFKVGMSDNTATLIRANTFANCFGCQNCSTVCPVVGSYDDPERELGLLPHQIMCCLGLGLVDMAGGSRMIWDCLTCYQCQEHCPQNVLVTDLLFALKNHAAKGREQCDGAITLPAGIG